MLLYKIIFIVCSYYYIIAGGNQTRESSAAKASVTPLSEFTPPSPPPRYFGTDFDGTFYTNDQDAFKRNIDAFIKVRKLGYVLYICTGRSLPGVISVLGQEFVQKTGYNGFPGIYHNGAIVYDGNGKMIRMVNFSDEILDSIHDHLSKTGKLGSCLFYSPNDYNMIEQATEELKEFLMTRKQELAKILTYEEIKNKKVVAVLLHDESELDLPGYTRGVDYVNHHHRAYKMNEIIPVSTDKADAIKLLVAEGSCAPSSTGFVGDGRNDIKALELCGYSFAPGNSSDLVKSCAKYAMEETNDDAAFAILMQKVYGIAQS